MRIVRIRKRFLLISKINSKDAKDVKDMNTFVWIGGTNEEVIKKKAFFASKYSVMRNVCAWFLNGFAIKKRKCFFLFGCVQFESILCNILLLRKKPCWHNILEYTYSNYSFSFFSAAVIFVHFIFRILRLQKIKIKNKIRTLRLILFVRKKDVKSVEKKKRKI